MNQRDDMSGHESERGRDGNYAQGQNRTEGGRDQERWHSGSGQDNREGHRNNWGDNRFGDNNRYGQNRFGRGGYYGGSEGHNRYGTEPRYGWEAGASQPHYGQRGGWDRNAGQDHYGLGQRNRWRDAGADRYGRGQDHSSEHLFDREPFGRNDDPRYFGTGAAGYGGPGFTGGAYGYGNGGRDEHLQLEDEYTDESSVSYERGGYREGFGRDAYGREQYGRGRDVHGRDLSARDPYGRDPYGRSSAGTGSPYRSAGRRFTTGPKGYQRSDERLKEDISERLMESHYIDSSDVSVEVRGAKVSLEGSVPSRHMKHAIEDLVDACPGVQDIDNRVRVAGPNYQGSAAAQAAAATGTSQGATGASSPTGLGSSPIRKQ